MEFYYEEPELDTIFDQEENFSIAEIIESNS